MSLVADVARWDGRCAASIKEVYRRHAARDDLAATLVDMLPERMLADGASWLLKHHLESGASLHRHQWAELGRALRSIETWPARLHLLQISVYWPSRLRAPRSTERFIREGLDHPRPLVRVWALHALFELATRYPEFRVEVEQRMSAGEREGTAAMKARIRDLQRRAWPATRVGPGK